MHLSLPSLPRIAEFSYKVPFQRIYQEIFGLHDNKDEKQKANFECASNFSKALEHEVDVFAKKLQTLIAFRDSRLLKNPEDFLRQEKSKHNRVGRNAIIKKDNNGVGKRAKRAIVALIAIAAAVVSMLTTISSSIYFAMEMNGLKIKI